MLKNAVFLGYVILNLFAIVLQAQPSDSSAVRAPLFLTARSSSAGFLPFSGRIVNSNPSVGVFLSYEWHPVTLFVFKNTDLRSGSSDVNYFQTGLFHSLHPASHFTAAPYLILEVPQPGKLYSPPYLIVGLILTFNLSENWSLENTTLFADGFRKIDAKDVIDRVQIKGLYRFGELSIFNWTNSARYDKSGFHSVGVMIKSPALGIAKIFDVNASLLYWKMLHREGDVNALDRHAAFTLTFSTHR